MTFSRFCSLLSSSAAEFLCSLCTRDPPRVSLAKLLPPADEHKHSRRAEPASRDRYCIHAAYVPPFVRKRLKNSSRSLLLATGTDRKLSPTSMVASSDEIGAQRARPLLFGSPLVAK